MPKNQNVKLSPSQMRARRRKTGIISAVILAVFILPPVLLALFFQPGAPNVLCKACHEMRAPYHAWTRALHQDTPCDECHQAPSVARMFMVKMQRRGKNDTSPIKVHISQANCVACHQNKIKQNLIVVKGIKFSHNKHFSSDIPCLTCHQGTGHNPEPAAAMLAQSGRANCLACHNDLHGKGSSECSACHAPSGFQLTSVTGKDLKQAGIKQPHHRNATEQNQDCSKCHSRQYCWGCHVTQKPHAAEGFDHVKESKANGLLCTQCHDFDFCSDCHIIKKEHTAIKDFNGKGHGLYADKVASCEGAACHTEQFCNKCHTDKGAAPLKINGGEIMHPSNFVKQHPLFASNDKDSRKCLECHENNFCIACHQGTSIHPEGWSLGHASHLLAISQGKPRTADDECTRCHATPFCSTCHKKTSAIVAPTHPANFKEAHKKDPSSKTGLCKNCHSQGSCSAAGCHVATSLPHPPEFRNGGHKNPAMAQTKECAKCHGPSFCMDCHKTSSPANHKPADWYKGHKQASEANRPYCALCHDDKQFCAVCHKGGNVITHGPGWDEKGHIKTNKASELASCAECHRQDTCSLTCHSKREIAKRVPEENHLYCAKCHVNFQWKLAGVSACAQCHPEPVAQSKDSQHADCAACHNVHQKTVVSCTSAACHETIPALLPKDHKNKCTTCHMAKAPADKKPTGHDWNSKALFNNCTSSDCHKNFKTLGLHKIKAHNRCGDCHEAHSAKALKFETACLKCHKPKDYKKLCATKGINCEDWK